jgi:1-acyl-sn-glycerol-3-phosphate acyltransferase
MMKEYLKKIPFVGYACYRSKHVYVGDSLSSIQKTVEQARETLRDGMSLVIFPEGTRTHDGKLQPFKRGAFMLANEIGLPIVPMTITGSYEVMNRRQKLPNFGRLHLCIHPAITEEQRKGKPTKVFMQEVYDIINTPL